MKFEKFTSSSLIWLVPICFLTLYILFPNNNSSIDAWAFASFIRNGEELFMPHHLFYTSTGFLIFNSISAIGFNPDALVMMKIVNAIFAFLSLVVFLFILKRLNSKSSEIAALLIIVGASFGFWRFAVENETYIIPLFFSLLSTLFFFKYIAGSKDRHVFLSGLTGAIACLYHQVHFFWWLGLLIGLVLYMKKIKQAIIYFLPALIVPFAYILVILIYQRTHLTPVVFFHYIFNDFYEGQVVSHIGKENFVLVFVSLIRTFIQVHGNIFLILDKYPRLAEYFLLALFLCVFVLFFRRRTKILIRTGNNQHLAKIFLIILCLQFLFAFFSLGNAEFMVMLPFVMIIIFISLFEIDYRMILFVGFFMLTWNFLFAIFPNYRFNYNNDNSYIRLVHDHPQNLYILTNKGDVEVKMYYLYGIKKPSNLIDVPAYLVSREKGLSGLENKINEYFVAGKKVYTNCLNAPDIFSRKNYLEKQSYNTDYFKKFLTITRDTITTFYGDYYLTEVKK